MTDVKISIPKDLYEKAEKYVKEIGFPSVEDYVVYLLSEAIAEGEEKELSKEEEEKIKARLRALGYVE